MSDIHQLLPFNPLIGGSNPHVQTLFARFHHPKIAFTPVWQQLNTPDGDELDIAWSEDPNQLSKDDCRPLFILFHGLEGSIDSPYAHGLMQAFQQAGWLSVIMHFRGCSGRPNKTARAYHSGETSDPRHFISWLHAHHPQRKKMAVGVSLGGNMLANYLIDYANQPLIDAATIVSAPFDLAACSERVNQGLSKVYQSYLLHSLKRNAQQKQPIYRAAIAIEKNQIRSISTLKQFDDQLTAPLHGFVDAKDYYARCSAISRLEKIRVPTLIIHAQDDPFMTQAVIPKQSLPSHIDYSLLKHGGHVGFVAGSIRKPIYWLEHALPLYYQS